MSSASFALPEFRSRAALAGGSAWRPAGSGATRATTSRRRAVRFARLLLVLVRLFVVARFRLARLSAAARAGCIQRWAHRLLQSLCIDVRARGHIPATDAPVLLVANHVSWLDIYAL